LSTPVQDFAANRAPKLTVSCMSLPVAGVNTASGVMLRERNAGPLTYSMWSLAGRCFDDRQRVTSIASGLEPGERYAHRHGLRAQR